MRLNRYLPRNTMQLLKSRQSGICLAQCGWCGSAVAFPATRNQNDILQVKKAPFKINVLNHCFTQTYKFIQTQRDRLRYICLTRRYKMVKLWVHNKHSRHFGLNWHYPKFISRDVPALMLGGGGDERKKLGGTLRNFGQCEKWASKIVKS